MTCEQMGGPCDHMISANTPKEMIDAGMEHLKKDHPEMLTDMQNMSADEKEKWNTSFMKSWEMTPDM
jgi:predicted small metal-binding protein